MFVICSVRQEKRINEEQERELAECVLRLANMLCGLTSCEFRRFAYDFVEGNSVKHF
jgi:hypothetical protein